jgi:hypothetical protein
VFEPSTSTFYIAEYDAGNVAIQFGQGTLAGGHPIVSPADFQGDGAIDPAVFEPSTSTFYIARHHESNEAVQFGQGTKFGGHPIPIASPDSPASTGGTIVPTFGVVVPDLPAARIPVAPLPLATATARFGRRTSAIALALRTERTIRQIQQSPRGFHSHHLYERPQPPSGGRGFSSRRI